MDGWRKNFSGGSYKNTNHILLHNDYTRRQELFFCGLEARSPDEALTHLPYLRNRNIWISLTAIVPL